MTLIDVLIGSALVLVIFLAFFALLRSSLLVSGIAKAKAGATAVANSQIEYVRSLEYANVGTVGGIPAGVVPQYATTTLNNIAYGTRTFIEYADDPADGSGASDGNGITTDYKHVRVAVSYTVRGETREVSVVSNIAPPSIETTSGGGTLRANVVDATGAAVSGASVRVVNASTSPAIDVTTFSNTSGVVDFPGAPASTQYQVYVAKTGYSSAQTYPRDGTNQNPTPGYLTVVANATTASTFAIDRLATLTLRTFSPIAANSFSDLFNDASKIVSSPNTQVTGGTLTLSGAPGSYAGSGSARATTTAPAYLASWTSATASISAPAGTDARFSVATPDGTLLPDAVLAGNSTGFTSPVSLAGVATTTYPALTLVASLSSSDVNQAPAINDWAVDYTEGPLPLPNVPLTLTGVKTKGSTGAGAPIYKTVIATTTDSTGVRTLSLEWDSYSLSVTGHTVIDAEPEAPYEVLPGSTNTGVLILSL